MAGKIGPSNRKTGTSAQRKSRTAANNVSKCPLEHQMAQLLPTQYSPPERFDLTRGYIPVMIVAGIMLALFSFSLTLGGELQRYKQEQSSLSSRMEKVEKKMGGVENKLDLIISRIIRRRHK
jgi:hypothetical protein